MATFCTAIWVWDWDGSEPEVPAQFRGANNPAAIKTMTSGFRACTSHSVFMQRQREATGKPPAQATDLDKWCDNAPPRFRLSTRNRKRDI